jgi:hypothetical protein
MGNLKVKMRIAVKLLHNRIFKKMSDEFSVMLIVPILHKIH